MTGSYPGRGIGPSAAFAHFCNFLPREQLNPPPERRKDAPANVGFHSLLRPTGEIDIDDNFGAAGGNNLVTEIGGLAGDFIGGGPNSPNPLGENGYRFCQCVAVVVEGCDPVHGHPNHRLRTTQLSLLQTHILPHLGTHLEHQNLHRSSKRSGLH